MKIPGSHRRKDFDVKKDGNQMAVVIEGVLYKFNLQLKLRKYLREYADVHFMSESEAVRHAIRQMIVSWRKGKAKEESK